MAEGNMFVRNDGFVLLTSHGFSSYYRNIVSHLITVKTVLIISERDLHL